MTILDSILSWLRNHGTAVSVLAAFSVLMFVGTLIAVPWMVTRLPADYFAQDKAPSLPWKDRHPVLRCVLIGLKNVAGILLVIAGLILSIPAVPGQGILTVIVGLSLLDVPGKRKLELRIVRTGPVRAALQWIRERGRKPPLEIPD